MRKKHFGTERVSHGTHDCLATSSSAHVYRLKASVSQGTTLSQRRKEKKTYVPWWYIVKSPICTGLVLPREF